MVRQTRQQQNQMAKIDTQRTIFMNNVLKRGRKPATKQKYISYFRQWIIYCFDFDLNPLQFPLDPNIVQHWVADRVEQRGNVKQLNAYFATLMNWISECFVFTRNIWIFDKQLTSFVKSLKKQYQESSAESNITIYYNLSYQ